MRVFFHKRHCFGNRYCSRALAGAGASAGTASTPTTRSTHAAAGKAAKSTKPVVVHVTAKVQKAANSAAAKVLGSTHNISSNVTQQVGGSCTGGAGCQNGKFTGNYFPGG